MIFCDAHLARRLEAAEAAGGAAATRALSRLRPAIGAAVESIAGGEAMFSGKDSPITQAFGVGLHGPVPESEMNRLEDFFHSRGAGVNVEHCPHADLSVAAHYARRGYRPIEFSNTLLRPISQEGGSGQFAAGTDRCVRPAAGISIRRISLEESDLWTRTVCQGFAEHFPVTPALLEVMSGFAHSELTVCFLAFADGAPAGGAALAMHEGVATVNGASTLPQFRNRGIQTALLRARLEYASTRGCDLAMTNTQPGSGSQRNVERLGFRVAYSRTKFFLP